MTFDVVDVRGNLCWRDNCAGFGSDDGLSAKNGLLPRIKIREVKIARWQKSTEQAMVVGAVHGYRGLVRELIT